jgi:hypothetical protein
VAFKAVYQQAAVRQNTLNLAAILQFSSHFRNNSHLVFYAIANCVRRGSRSALVSLADQIAHCGLVEIYAAEGYQKQQ